MWTAEYDIIVETLTGSKFEVTVTDDDTIEFIKTRIQKYEGIPISQQHLIYNQRELNEATEIKDVPLVHGSRLKLVLGLKGGPVSARCVVTLLDFDTTWFDLSDVLNSSRQDPLTISPPGVKLLVYKDCKKNIHRVMKFRADRKNANNTNAENASDLSVDIDGQFLKDNLNTMEKMHQLRTQLELKKKDKNSKQNSKSCESISSSSNGAYNKGSNSFGVQCVKSLIKVKMGTTAANNASAAGGGTVVNRYTSNGSSGNGGAISSFKSYTEANNDTASGGSSSSTGKHNRRIYFPPLKGSIDNNSIGQRKNLRSEASGSVANEYNSAGGTLLNKHGIAKTCVRASSLNTNFPSSRC